LLQSWVRTRSGVDTDASKEGAGSAPVKVNRTFTVLGSNPEQKICLSTVGRQPHIVLGSKPKQREMCLHGAGSARSQFWVRNQSGEYMLINRIWI
jgi:hypothetical protein